MDTRESGTAIIKSDHSDRVQLGMIELQSEEVIARAAAIAKALAKVIKDRELYRLIRGRAHVRVEGWTTLGAMLGISPREREVRAIRPEESLDGDPGYEAYVELIRLSDGIVVGGASAICTRGESNWSERDTYALRSMAITRATGKAFRLSLSWIMQLAGFDPTPAEEMPAEEEEKPAPQAKQASNGPARRAWPVAHVTALVSEGLADNPANAVAILNLSPFTHTEPVANVIRWARIYRARHDEGLESSAAAKVATNEYRSSQ